jgi:hypothetical protein
MVVVGRRVKLFRGREQDLARKADPDVALTQGGGVFENLMTTFIPHDVGT